MTKMLSVRISDEEAEALESEVKRSNLTASELLRSSLRMVLARGAAERDAATYEKRPFVEAELIDPADQAWLVDEDWSAWRQRVEAG